MSNAFAPRPFEEFEDEFDLEAGYAAPGAPASPQAYEDTAGDQRQALLIYALIALFIFGLAVRGMMTGQPL